MRILFYDPQTGDGVAFVDAASAPYLATVWPNSGQLMIDEAANPDVAADLTIHVADYSVQVGTLRRQGKAVTLAPDQRAADTATVLQAFAAIVPDPAAQAALARILGAAPQDQVSVP